MQRVIPKVEKIADFGSGEPFVARIVMGLPEILRATEYQNQEEIEEAIMEIFMNGLAPAFRSIQSLREIENGKRERLLMDLRKEYFAFYDRLWAAYKDRMQEVIRRLGYDDFGFLFSTDEDFEKKATAFFDKHPEVRRERLEFLRNHRSGWQNAVARFRNEYAEHQKIFDKDVEELLSLDAAEICFKNCWTAIEMILAELISTRLYPFAGIEEIPESERDPSVPKRFRVMYRM
jgi:hypothetical protein